MEGIEDWQGASQCCLLLHAVPYLTVRAQARRQGLRTTWQKRKTLLASQCTGTYASAANVTRTDINSPTHITLTCHLSHATVAVA